MKALGGFLSVGLVSTALHYAVMTVAMLNRRFSFASQRPHRQGLPRFALMVSVGVLLNSLLLALGLHLGLHYLPAQVVATGGVMGFNFACMKYWVFNSTPPERRG